MGVQVNGQLDGQCRPHGRGGNADLEVPLEGCMVDTPGEFFSLVKGLKFRCCVDLSFSCPGNEIGLFSSLRCLVCNATNYLTILPMIFY